VAEAELQAVFNQIQDTMTSEQISAIADLQLTGEEMAQLMENLGLSFGFGGSGFGDLTPEQQATAQAARESGGGFPGGDFPGGGGFPGGGNRGGQAGLPGADGGQISPEQQATIEARRAERVIGCTIQSRSLFRSHLFVWMRNLWQKTFLSSMMKNGFYPSWKHTWSSRDFW
jgi:hypothetical protein